MAAVPLSAPFEYKRFLKIKWRSFYDNNKGPTDFDDFLQLMEEGGGYELIAGHRRQKASELAGYPNNVPCVVRNRTYDEAIFDMTESNFNQRSEILPSERANALRMQLEAINHQGARFEGIASCDVGKRSNELVAERNQMKPTTVKRYICLNNLIPELMQMVDDKKIPFTPAGELSYIRPKNQKYIAIAIEGQQSSPSLAQAQRMRKLDHEKTLNPNVIDGIMLETKKGAATGGGRRIDRRTGNTD